MLKIQIRGYCRKFIAQKNSSIGVGAMIVFIAMVLVAGIAASVLIQTSINLETQAMKTGSDTKDDVSCDIDVLDICGQYGTRTIAGTPYTRYHNMSVIVTPRGASEINLGEVVLQISNEDKLVSLTYDSTFSSTVSGSGIFQTSNMFDLNASSFGVIVIEDEDTSMSEDFPTINNGDKAALTVNLSASFSGFTGRQDIRGMVIPEHGSPGIFLFRTPATTIKTVVNFL
jgi:flagellin FlaB